MTRKLEVYGKVREPNGRGVRGVTIRARPTSGSGATRTTTTERDGSYILPGLPPGSYVISASKRYLSFKNRTVSVSLNADKKIIFVAEVLPG